MKAEARFNTDPLLCCIQLNSSKIFFPIWLEVSDGSYKFILNAIVWCDRFHSSK